MGSSYLLAALAILLILKPTNVKADLNDLISPYLDNVCKEAKCGKGSCKASIDYYPPGYICECEAGWKRTREDDLNDDFKHLPCVIPNCTLDYSCSTAPPPVPDKRVPINASFFDPCYWIYCGEGSCKRQSDLTHACECKEGFKNLNNVSIYPCFSDCVIGADCARLGIRSSKSTSSPNLPETGSNKGGSNKGSLIMPGKLNWLIMLLMPVAMVLWK